MALKPPICHQLVIWFLCFRFRDVFYVQRMPSSWFRSHQGWDCPKIMWKSCLQHFLYRLKWRTAYPFIQFLGKGIGLAAALSPSVACHCIMGVQRCRVPFSRATFDSPSLPTRSRLISIYSQKKKFFSWVNFQTWRQASCNDLQRGRIALPSSRLSTPEWRSPACKHLRQQRHQSNIGQTRGRHRPH